MHFLNFSIRLIFIFKVCFCFSVDNLYGACILLVVVAVEMIIDDNDDDELVENADSDCRGNPNAHCNPILSVVQSANPHFTIIQ